MGPGGTFSGARPPRPEPRCAAAAGRDPLLGRAARAGRAPGGPGATASPTRRQTGASADGWQRAVAVDAWCPQVLLWSLWAGPREKGGLRGAISLVCVL